MQLDLFDPILNIIKTISLIDRISQNDAHSSSIVSLSDSFEFFLSGSIPNLKSDFLLPNAERFSLEINSNGGEVWGHKIALAVSQEQIGFANSTIAYN